MPPKKDFTGQRFGVLLVKKAGEIKNYGGKKTQFWWCLCEFCENEALIPQPKLWKMRCCADCARGNCVICEKRVPRNRPRSNTCSEHCEEEKRKAIQNRSYARRSTDPDFNRSRAQRVVQRMLTDPCYAEHIRSVRRNAQRRWLSNPDNRAHVQVYQAQRWQENKDALMNQRRLFWESLSDEDRIRYRERDRSAWRDYARRYRAWLRENPAAYLSHIEKSRAYARDYERKKALARFMKDAQALSEKFKGIET